MQGENLHLNKSVDACPDIALSVYTGVDHKFCDWLLSFADRYRYSLWASLLLFYAAAFNGQWRIQSDAALYLSIGRNLAHGLGYTYLGQTNRLAYPGWPTLIALTFKLFGSKSLVPVNALMTLIALATLAATYRLFLLHLGRPTAVVVSVGVGLTKAFFTYGFELWSDMPFALGVMCMLAGYEGLSSQKNHTGIIRRPSKKLWVDAAFFVIGLLIAASMRPTIWPLLTALALALICRAFKRKNWRWISAGMISTLIVAIGLCYMFGWIRAGSPGFGGVYEEYLVNRINGKSGVATHSLTENFCNLFLWAASDVLFQARLGFYCNAMLSTLVLALGVGLFRYRTLWGFWFCLLLATILVSQETLDRYFLPVLPLLVFAWWDFIVRINRGLPGPVGNIIFLTLLSAGAVMNVTKVGGIISQQQQRPFLASYDKGVFDGELEFARQLNQTVGDKALVLARAPYGRVTAYLSERYVIGAIGAPTDLLKSHHVFVMEPSDINMQNELKSAGLVEGPALFTITPSPGHGAMAVPLSLHSTHRRNP